jgi:hypothetical protein
MRLRKATFAALVLTGAAVALAIVFGGGEEAGNAKAAEAMPGVPTVSIVSPRNGEVQSNHAVVVKVDLETFELAPRNFLAEPQLDQGAIRFGLNRVPNCVDPKKLQKAINSPLGNERLTGASMDFPKYSGPNGILAERLGTADSFSPATRPEIFYHELPPGFYRLTVTLAQNNLATTPYHDVTNFQIQQKAGHHQKKCPAGYVSSAKAAEKLE